MLRFRNSIILWICHSYPELDHGPCLLKSLIFVSEFPGHPRFCPAFLLFFELAYFLLVFIWFPRSDPILGQPLGSTGVVIDCPTARISLVDLYCPARPSGHSTAWPCRGAASSRPFRVLSSCWAGAVFTALAGPLTSPRISAGFYDSDSGVHCDLWARPSHLWGLSSSWAGDPRTRLFLTCCPLTRNSVRLLGPLELSFRRGDHRVPWSPRSFLECPPPPQALLARAAFSNPDRGTSPQGLSDPGPAHGTTFRSS